MLSIFSDRRFLPDGVKHALPLIPFWGDYLDHDGYTRFAFWARDNWRLTNPEDAQIAVLPFDGREIVGRGTMLRRSTWLGVSWISLPAPACAHLLY